MTTKDFMLNLIPPETRKSENMNKLFGALSNFFDWYIEDINKNSNYTILEELSGDRLEKYGSRFGATRLSGWTDSDLKKRIKLLWYVYDYEISILDNLSRQFSLSSGFYSQISINVNGISGEIDCVLVIPEGEEQEPFSDIDDFWVFGCKINTTIITEANYSVYDSFGDLRDEKYNTGLDPLTLTSKTV